MLMPKRPRLDSPSAFKSHTPSPTPSLKSESSSRSRKSDESDSDTDVAGLAEIMDEINCTVCKWVCIVMAAYLLRPFWCHVKPSPLQCSSRCGICLYNDSHYIDLVYFLFSVWFITSSWFFWGNTTVQWKLFTVVQILTVQSFQSF